MKPLTQYQKHAERWGHGCGSAQCERAKNVVLLRGQVPCDLLFLGEAPGESEDVLGRPFVGPAGHLLDGIIAEALGVHTELRWAFTNIVSCIPRDDLTGTMKATEPDLDQIKACRPRLVNAVRLCRPRMVVLVGLLAKKHVGSPSSFRLDGADEQPEWIPANECLRFVEIVHPAAILRAVQAQRSMMRKRAVVTLANAVDELLIPF